MGVTGLWTVLQPCARPIKIETLNKKRLAVDASIWIYQFLKAVRDKEGNALRNSHIVGFFRRVCKLLFIGIKPVFVFDGGAPALKRQTISNRKSRREGRREDAVRTAAKLLAIQMQRAAEEEEKKRKEAARQPTRTEQEEEIPENLVYAEEILQTQQERAQNRTFRRKDQYHLPELGKSMNEMGGMNDPRVMSLEELEEYARLFDRGEDINVYDFSKIDFDGHFFQSLPAADRYNILNAARLRSRLRMGHSKEQLDAMFPDRMAFSRFQIERVRERNGLTQRLMNINGMNDDAFSGGAHRVAGERDREYVLVKNDGVEGGWALGVVTSKDGGKADKPIDIDLPPPPEEDAEEWEEDEDFEDVPIEGLNRLPKPRPRLTEQQKEGREFIASELATRRRRFYNSRKDTPKQSRPRKASPVNNDPNSLFVAGNDEVEEWEDVAATNGDGLFEGAGDDVENQQLQQAIALSMQQDQEEDVVNDEPEIDVPRDTYQQKRAEDTNPFAKAKGSGMSIARLANKSSNKVAPKGPFAGSDSEEDDMDLQAALLESRKTKRAVKPRQASPQKTATGSATPAKLAPTSFAASGFDGPLPFEKLNLGSSLLGKKKMQRLEQESAGGFEKDTGKEKDASAPLPPWFKGDRNLDDELAAQRQEENREWEQTRKREEDQFQFQRVSGLRQQQSQEIIDLDAPTSQKEVIALDSDDEPHPSQDDIPIDDASNDNAPKDSVPAEDDTRMGDLAEKIRAEPPKPRSPQQKSPPRQDPALVKEGPFVESSDEEPVEWSESEPEEEREAKTVEPPLEKQPTPPQQPSEAASDDDFEDVPMTTSVPAEEPQPEPHLEFEDVPIRTEASRNVRRESTPMLEGPEDLLLPVVPNDPVEAGDLPIELPQDEEDQYSDPEDAELFASLAAEAQEHARFAQELNNNTTARIDFDQELKQLRAQQKKDRRDADEVTQTMIAECQQLLTLFGLPYVTAPMEAEAQCAELVHLGLVDGIVTDDSDTFLFGGTRVYKNMFNAAKFVECYLSQDLKSEFSLTREKLIAIAQLLGSDYTTGIPGIGPVTALEILSEFPDLEEFKDWWNAVQDNTRSKEEDADSPFRRRFRRSQGKKLFLPVGFPDPRVAEAYLDPEVDSDPEPFQWGVPDLAALRTYLSSQIGWSWERTDEVLVPVIRDMNRREQEGTQANITRFFEGSVGAGAFAPRVRTGAGGKSKGGPQGKKRGTAAAGKRLGAALTKLAEREGARGGKGGDDASLEDEDMDGTAESEDVVPKANAGGRKRKARSTTQSAAAGAEDDFDAAADEENDEEDEAYREPKKKSRKTRKSKAAA